MGHSPYRQWVTYRRRRLFILTSAAEEPSFPLGEAIVQVLIAHFPESQAMAARAKDSLEIIKLIGSQQLDVALLLADETRNALEGKGKFRDEGPLPVLKILFVFGSYLLICRDDFPKQKAYQVAKTLSENENVLKSAVPAQVLSSILSSKRDRPMVPSLPFHPGALDFYEGRPLPTVEEETY